MKPLSPTTIFIFSSSRSLFTRTIPPPCFTLGLSHFSTSSPDSSSSYHSSARRNSDEARDVRVSVWWDFENCGVPSDANVFRVSQSIIAAVRTNCIKGPVQITAFGDVLKLSRSNQEALSSTGINLTHIPQGGKNSADRSLLVDLMYWVSQNPPPAHLFLISGDRDFASILHRLRMSNYNILLASRENAPAVLCSAASIMWQWTALVKGENLSGKHFNRPPDGPFASWYGHYRGPLEDPFAVANQTSCLQPEEPSDSNSDIKLRPIPKAVVNVIRSILNSYPKGLSITDLRNELGKSNVTVEKDLYGHKKFSRFLLALPQVLKLQHAKDGQFIVCGIGPKGRETVVPSPDMGTGPNTSSKGKDSVLSSEENGGHNPSMNPRADNLSSPLKLTMPKPYSDTQAPPYSNSQEPPKKQEKPQLLQEQPHLAESARNGEVCLGQLHRTQVEGPTPEVGFFKTIRRKWFSGNYGNHEIRDTVKKCSTSQDSNEIVNADVKGVPPTGQSADPGRLHTSSLSTNKGVPDAEASAANVDTFKKPDSIFNKIVRWCKFWRRDENSDMNAELSKSDEEITSCSEMQEMLTESFWKDTLAFLETPKGSATILQSKTRQEMVQNFQQFGPSKLQSLSERHIQHLVDLLISEKKWVEECPSQTFPFKFVGPARRSPCSKPLNSMEHPKVSKEFGDSESNLHSHGEERCTKHNHLGGSKDKLSAKSRNRILSECQKLVNEVVKEYPDGFNVSGFRPLFHDKYGYDLEVKQLGYQKLATLLQIMPGVKLESNHIFPCGDHKKGLPSEKDGSRIKEYPKSNDDHDSQWEELGPIAQTNTKKDFENLSDNDMSDSEEESLPGGNENQAKRGTEEDSSLLQILDSWYSNREDSNWRVVPPSECSDDSKSRVRPSSGEAAKKQKPSKHYSFVAVEKPKDDKEKLINGILGSLKKSGDASLESKIEG